MDRRTLKIYIFYCANSIEPQELMRLGDKLQGDTVRQIRLPCSGKVTVPYLVKAFETGADGLVIVTCKRDECRRLEGNMRAQKRAQAVDSLLEEVGLGPGRIAVIQRTDAGTEQIIEDIETFCRKIRSMPQDYVELQPSPDNNDISAMPVPEHQETTP
jgi:coenzyme F420-reducing hydrogenase delta subunit